MNRIYKSLSLIAIFTIVFSLTGPAQNAWFNEIHYNDYGTDTNEFIEVVILDAGGYNLADFGVVLYNGNNGESYSTITLDEFTEGETINSFTLFYYMYETNGIQNGEPDGMALVYNEEVIYGQWLSYEGTFTAVDGPAAGMTSVDIGVMEDGEEEGLSLQLSGTGSTYVEFSWQLPAAETHGQPNNGQSFILVGIDEQDVSKPVIFPNPNDGHFRLDNTSGEDLVVSFCSSAGSPVKVIKAGPGEQYISLDGLSKGMYMVRFESYDGKMQKTERMILQ
jgi:hypothetical protein